MAVIRGQVFSQRAEAALTIELVRADDSTLMKDFEPIVAHA